MNNNPLCITGLITIILTIIYQQLELNQLNMKTAYLEGKIDEKENQNKTLQILLFIAGTIITLMSAVLPLIA